MKNVKKQIITEITRLINNEVCKYPFTDHPKTNL